MVTDSFDPGATDWPGASARAPALPPRLGPLPPDAPDVPASPGWAGAGGVRVEDSRKNWLLEVPSETSARPRPDVRIRPSGEKARPRRTSLVDPDPEAGRVAWAAGALYVSSVSGSSAGG